ncbi:MAG: putative ubiquitin-RnfH superfamily antitoxin RatB of RatAB toxin-antitoxin module [Gammaproteobacteria bacterium]|jgi:putative ubiquitin-RnfH superfamily antitoxin RatB of RatAB toxin-antitoxin module
MAPKRNTSLVEVQVVFALRERQVLRTLHVEPSCTVIDAVQRSAVLDEFPKLDRAALSFAVFGASVAGTQCVRDGDRLEILRALQVDPREARRRRARLKKSSQ